MSSGLSLPLSLALTQTPQPTPSARWLDSSAFQPGLPVDLLPRSALTPFTTRLPPVRRLTLRAFADCYQVCVHVVTSTDEHWYLQYTPQSPDGAAQLQPKCEVFLTYLSPVHYDALTATTPFDDSPDRTR